LVLTDLKMPRVDGLTVLRTLQAEQPEVEVVVLTAHGSVDSAVEAMKLGAFDYLQKPISSPTELRLLAERALERQRARASAEARKRDGEQPLTYGAPAMKTVVTALEKVSATDATVLLLGESGTGKEVAARSVHRWSRRGEGPFIAVNCAALSASLLESELFGHEKGAFTGAVARRRGRIELADGGTFFLDEVGELEPTLQAKLLRVLQERAFERVGGTQTVTANVRWIAATNRDLQKMVAEGGFREDLYHRLAVFPVQIPPLRDRREDVLPLADLLLSQATAQIGRGPMRLSDSAKRALLDASWTGNVRELANTLERAAILADGDEVSEEHVLLFPTGTPAVATTSAATTPRSMADIEREAIQSALDAASGNRKRAAEILEIGLRTLYEKIKKYELG